MFPARCRGLLFLLSLSAVGALAGCASLPVPRPLSAAAQGAAQGTQDAFAFSGRIAVVENDHNTSGGIHWRHEGARDDILLLTPLGQGVAQIVNDADGATLRTNDDKVYRAPDAEQLTLNVTGWRIPVSGLVFWLRGLPQPGSAAHEERDGKGRLLRVTQDNWKIEYPAYFDAPEDRLPRRVVLTRPEFELKLVVDNWERADELVTNAIAAPPAKP
jgi:outer membrane lipoprotein LolB